MNFTPAWTCPSGNLIPNINKQSIKRNEIVVFWCVYSWFLVWTHQLEYTFILFLSVFGLGFDLFDSGFHCTKFDFPFNSSWFYVGNWNCRLSKVAFSLFSSSLYNIYIEVIKSFSCFFRIVFKDPCSSVAMLSLVMISLLRKSLIALENNWLPFFAVTFEKYPFL